MYNMQKLCAAFLCSFTMCFRVVYKIKQRTELQFVPFGAPSVRKVPRGGSCISG